jgi:hypothetical protein
MSAQEKVAYTPLPTSNTDIDVERLVEQPTTKRSCFRTVFVRVSLALMAITLLHHAAPRVLRATGCHRGLATGAPTVLPAHFALPSGDKIPAVALGVWQAQPDEARKAVKTALDTGYRHIDGAWAYRNEKEVGQAVSDSGLKVRNVVVSTACARTDGGGVQRKDIWLTSKLWNAFHDPKDVEGALDETLSHLGTDYLDLYLMHWPVAFKGDAKTKEGKPVIDEKLTADPYPTWQKMEEMVKKGKVRNIGVSKFVPLSRACARARCADPCRQLQHCAPAEPDGERPQGRARSKPGRAQLLEPTARARRVRA